MRRLQSSYDYHASLRLAITSTNPGEEPSPLDKPEKGCNDSLLPSPRKSRAKMWEIPTIAWIVAGCIQCIFWIVLGIPLLKYKPSKGHIRPPVSVIVCAHRLFPNFPQLLTSLSKQDYPEYEVIIVNDGPLPGISEMIAKNGDWKLKEIPFNAATRDIGGKKPPLAAGIAAARHQWLLMTDADCMVRKDWIAAMTRHLNGETQIVLGVGPFFREPGWINVIARFDNAMIAVQYLGMAVIGLPYMGVGRNLMYHRKVYEESGGFPHRDLVSGDDDLFVQRVAHAGNTAISIAPQSMVFSHARDTWEDFLSQKRRHLSTGPRYRPLIKGILIAFALTYGLYWIGLIVVGWIVAPQTFLFMLVPGLLQWMLFVLVTRKLRTPASAILYPLFAMGYALFLIVLGFLALKPVKRTWNT